MDHMRIVLNPNQWSFAKHRFVENKNNNKRKMMPNNANT